MAKRHTFLTKHKGQCAVPFTTPPGDLVNDSATHPLGQVIGQQSFTLVTMPAALAGIVRHLITNVPDGDWTYDTLTAALQSHVASRLFVQSGFDYEWRRDVCGHHVHGGALNDNDC